MRKSYIAVFLIGFFIVATLPLNAQERKKQLTKEQKEAAKLERRERRLQLIAYLDGITQKATLLDTLEDRVRVLTEVSDALWFLDKARATALFTQVFQSIDTIAAEPGAEANSINSLRQPTLARIARRDPELAAKLISNATTPALREVDRSSRELNAMSTPSADTLMAVALSLLKTDLQQSVSLARIALRDGMSQTARIYLQQLRPIEQATANSLIELSLRDAAARTPARLFDVLAFWEYAFQPNGFHFGPISWPRSAETRSYEVSQSLKLAVIQFAIAAINQNIQSRFSTDEANTVESNRRFAQLYSVVQQLLPDIAVYVPRAADALRGELEVLEQAIRTSGQSLPSLRDFGSSTERTNNAVDSLLYKAERTTGGKERDELYLAAAYRLLFDGQHEKAASIAARIDDFETKNVIADAINFNWAGSQLASNNTTEALVLARAIRSQEAKVVALAKIGAVVATKGDAVLAEEILHESQTLASKATPSSVIGAAVLSIALTRAGAQRDAAKAFEALSLAVSILNKTNSDSSLWQMLSAQSGTTLKTASLNSVQSPGGGLKSIRVTYPRLAGLVEAFAAASTNDLHQAMRVAQDLSSKPLSLSVQAAVCRSAAERLVQEETNLDD